MNSMATPTQEMPPELAVAETTAKSAAPVQRTIHTAQLVTAMLKANTQVSDLIFSPGRAPQIEVSGQLMELKYKGLECLTSQDTNYIAHEIMGKNETPARKLEQDGSADLSYGITGVGRFRVNIFKQRGSCAIVMRVVPDKIPGFDEPIEFLHRHKKATVHQRELHSDTPTFALALRAALRQAPKFILVGEGGH